jgi:glycosyltransferase involved in cell wall biosynthesis
MRIGIISFEMTSSGGEQRQVLRLAKELQEMGHTATIYAYRYSPAYCYPALGSGLSIRAVETVNEQQLASGASPVSKLSVAARRYFLESRVLAQQVGPVDVLNPHGRPAHRAAVFVKRKTGTPIVWTPNDIVGWESAGHRARMPVAIHALACAWVGPWEQRIVRDIEVISVLDHNVGQILQRAYGRPTRVVPSGVDTQALDYRPEAKQKIRRRHSVPDGAFVVLWLGILEPFRRIEDLVEAVRILRQRGVKVHALVVGRHDTAPHYSEQLTRLVTRYQLGSLVRFIAQSVPEEEMADYYSACDVFVFPNDQQAWGLAPLEALACRRPVVVSRGSGVHEVLVDGETALLVPPRDPEALARAIDCLRNDAQLRERIGQQGHEFVARELSWKNYATRMANLFQGALVSTTCPAEASRAYPLQSDWATRIIAASEPLWRVR